MRVMVTSASDMSPAWLPVTANDRMVAAEIRFKFQPELSMYCSCQPARSITSTPERLGGQFVIQCKALRTSPHPGNPIARRFGAQTMRAFSLLLAVPVLA